jgi:hypothetical protein
MNTPNYNILSTLPGCPASTSAAAAATTSSVVVKVPTTTGLTVTLTRYVGRRPLLLRVIEVLVVRDGFAIVETFEAVLEDGTEMNKNIFASVIGSDESKSLVTEELDFASACHDEVELCCVEMCKKS